MVETGLFSKSPFRPSSPQLKVTQINYGAVSTDTFFIFYLSFLNIPVGRGGIVSPTYHWFGLAGSRFASVLDQFVTFVG